MVALTAMLVMTTLLLSVSNNSPPTNNVKLIDVCMLFGMEAMTKEGHVLGNLGQDQAASSS